MKLNLVSAIIFFILSNNVNAATISGQGTWETTLQSRDLDGNASTAEAYYDTVLDITWLADANYADTSGYHSNGHMDKFAATYWVNSLSLGGVGGWRLPNTIDVGNDGYTYYTNEFHGVDAGYNITTHSELSHMFYNVLGNTAWFDTSGIETGCTAPDYCLTNTGPFSNLQSESYWSGTDFAPIITSSWRFSMKLGQQSQTSKTYQQYAWAVHDGDVGAAVVPLPPAIWLFGTGLIGLIGIAKCKRA